MTATTGGAADQGVALYTDDAGTRFSVELADRLHVALGAADRQAVDDVLALALTVAPPLEVAEGLIAPVLNRLGEGWSNGTVALAQLYLGGKICEERINTMLPDADLVRADAPRLGIAVLADQHTLGKRIVATFLRIAGFPIKDFGAGLAPQQLAASVRADDLDALLVSTLMLPSALQVTHLTDLLRDHRVKVFVGGAPFLFDPDLWRAVGADGMGRNAAEGLTLVEGLRKEAT